MKLYVDDLRPAPPGWELAKSSLEALAWLNLWRNNVETFNALSLSHDLSGNENTRPVILWMAQHNYWPKVLYLHATMESEGRQWIQHAADQYAPDDMIRTWAA
jgi:hypothetical protein